MPDVMLTRETGFPVWNFGMVHVALTLQALTMAGNSNRPLPIWLILSILQSNHIRRNADQTRCLLFPTLGCCAHHYSTESTMVWTLQLYCWLMPYIDACERPVPAGFLCQRFCYSGSALASPDKQGFADSYCGVADSTHNQT